MENYYSNNEELEALDFTSSSSKREYFASAPALDLSCKRLSDVKNPTYMLSPSSSDNFPSSPPSSDSNMDHHDRLFNDHENTYMVTSTPPDSPRINKFNETFYARSPNEELINNQYLRMQMLLPTVLPSMIAPFKTTSGGTLQHMQLPISSSSLSSTSSSPSSAQTNDLSMIIQQDTNKKMPRPFKAYPKDPLSLTIGSEYLYDQSSCKSYNEYRQKMLETVKNNNNKSTNIKMRRTSNKSPPSERASQNDEINKKDSLYWQKRQKNNEAAKRSRDARRAKEDEIAIRAAYLEHENKAFKIHIAALQEEIRSLRLIAARRH